MMFTRKRLGVEYHQFGDIDFSATLFIEAAERAKIISFDFYDTLFTRPLTDPELLFDIIGETLSIKNFLEDRKKAQTSAFQKMHESGRFEITLNDIYSFINYSEINSEQIELLEERLEKILLSPNPEIFPLFKFLCDKGHKVIITSDMYLSKTFFQKHLNDLNLLDIDLFISSDKNATKRDQGHLFDKIIRHFQIDATDLVHIGDSKKGDYEKALERGVIAFHYKPFWLNEEKSHKDLNPQTSLSIGLNRIFKKTNETSIFEEVGYKLGGAFLVSFYNWLSEQCQIDKIDHLLLVSRDGYNLSQLANIDEECDLPKYSYFFGSRNLFTLACVDDQNFQSYINFFLSGNEGLSPYELLERLGVQAPDSNLMMSIGFPDDYIISSSDTAMLRSLISAFKWQILRVCERNRRCLIFELTKIGIKNGQKVGFVDIGWNGTTQDSFSIFVKKYFDIQLHGYYFSLTGTDDCKSRRLGLNMKALIEPTKHSKEYWEAIYKYRVLLEFLFSAPHPTVIGLALDNFKKGVVTPIFDEGRGVSDQDNIIKIEDIIKGELHFAKEFLRLSRSLKLKNKSEEIANFQMTRLLSGELKDIYKDLLMIEDFDTWASTKNQTIKVIDYL